MKQQETQKTVQAAVQMSGLTAGQAADKAGDGLKGLEISERFYEEYGREMITSQFPEYEGIIAVGIAGEGSDCFGYDDGISRDHDFEAGFCLWIPDRLERELEFKLSRAYGKLPESYLGVERAKQSLWGHNRRGVILNGSFYSRFTGRPGLPESPVEWLALPEHSLACAVNGKVFRDDLGEFSAVRRELQKGYPEDVRLKKIAARAVMMAQSGQYNVARCAKRGEYGAAAFALHEFVQNALSMIFLLEHRYLPYYKWAFRAGKELPAFSGLAERLERLAAGGLGWCREEKEYKSECVPGSGAEDAAVSRSAMHSDGYNFIPERQIKLLAEEIEEICCVVTAALKSQGLTDGNWDYLEPHGYEVASRIRDGNLRNLHVMEG